MDYEFNHFFGAVKKSWIGISISILLFIMCVFLLVFCPNNDNSVTSLFIGVIASIIASIIYNIYSNYSKSCSIFLWVLDQTEVLITYIENNKENFINDEWYRFELWRSVVTIRENARQLTYTCEFDCLSTGFSNVINAAYKNNIELLEKELLKLSNIRDRITKNKKPYIESQGNA